MEITSVALCVSIGLVLFGIAYYYFTTRNSERMALLAKGLPGDYFSDRSSTISLLLILGFVCLGISAGLGAAVFVRRIAIPELQNVALPLCVFFFLGMSLCASYVTLLRRRTAESTRSPAAFAPPHQSADRSPASGQVGKEGAK